MVERLGHSFMVRKVPGSIPTRARGWKTLSVQLAANGYLILFRTGEGLGGEERNWPPYLIMPWLSKCATLTKHIPNALIECGTTFTFTGQCSS